MKALQVVRHARPGEALEIREVPVPEPGPGQVRIRVHAASLNFNDVDACWGRKRSVNPELPFTIGMDVCGVVDATGPGAEAWQGRRVVAITLTALGGLADHALAPVDSVFDAPAELDDSEAAGFLLPFHTTHLALFRRGRLQAGETLLVHSGASGLGSAAIQLGAACGAKVIASAGGPDKLRFCRELGAELAIDHLSEDLTERVLEHTAERGADVVCDLAGGSFVEPSFRCVAREGRYLVVGFADDPENGMAGRALRPVATGNFSIVGVLLAWVSDPPPILRRVGFQPFGRDVAEEVHEDLLRLLREKRIHPTVRRRIALEEAPQALEDHEARRTMGRTVVQLSP